MIVVLLLGAGASAAPGRQRILGQEIHQIIDNFDAFLKHQTHPSTRDALEFLGAALEDCPLTNAGTGSELTQRGEIECDACFITSPKIHSAAVSGVKNVKNPLLICSQMLLDSSPNGLSCPRFLTGDGAHEYAKLKDLKLGYLDTQRSRDAFNYWTSRHKITDTIGVITVDAETFAAGSSSGGSLLKFPGRVGPAAVPGAAADIHSNSASVCSGFGEDILQSSLARLSNTTDDLNDLPKAMQEYQLQRDPYFGVIRASREGKRVYVDYYHTTEGMNFAIFDTKTSVRHIYFKGSSSGGWVFDL